FGPSDRLAHVPWCEALAPTCQTWACSPPLPCAAFFERNRGHSQLSAPPFWYSITRVSKKFFSFLRSIASDIQGNGFSASLHTQASRGGERRGLGMKCMYCSPSAALGPRNPLGLVSRP